MEQGIPEHSACILSEALYLVFLLEGIDLTKAS